MVKGFLVFVTLGTIIFLCVGCISTQQLVSTKEEHVSVNDALVKPALLTSTYTPEMSTPTISKTPWISPTIAPTTTELPTFTPTITKLSPDPAIVEQKIVELFETNGGCDLPCWWGYEVGITTWEEIESELEPYAVEVRQMENERVLLFSVPEYLSFNERLGIRITINSQGVVEEIDPPPIEYQSSRYSLASVLRVLGEPTEVWLIADHLFNPQFSITIFYDSYGIQLIYNGSVRTNDEFMLICPTMIFDYGDPNILIWRPGLYSGLVEKFGPQDDMYEIDEVTDMTVSEFYSLYSKNSSRCIQMPIEYSDS